MVIDNYVYYRQGKIKGSDCKSEILKILKSLILGWFPVLR